VAFSFKLFLILLVDNHPFLKNIVRCCFFVLILMSILAAESIALIFFEIMMMFPHLLFLLFLLFLQTFLRLFQTVLQILFCQMLFPIITITNMSGSKIIDLVLCKFGKFMLVWLVFVMCQIAGSELVFGITKFEMGTLKVGFLVSLYCFIFLVMELAFHFSFERVTYLV